MLVNAIQLTLEECYTGVLQCMEERKPELIAMLESYLDFDRLIPTEFYRAYYHSLGRPTTYHLESMLKAIVLQLLFGLKEDKQLIAVLKCSKELRDYCGFSNVPCASKFTRFRQDYCKQIENMFNHLVEITEPICREIDAKKADYLIYDTTGIEVCVKENNPKFLDTKLKAAKKSAKSNPAFDPYKAVYGLLPPAAAANPDARQQYIDGHFCYALKAGILTNGLGIVRSISFFDDEFRNAHPETDVKKDNNPELAKEIADSKSLKPALSDFFSAHPDFSFGTFLGDSAFDSYANYSLLKNEFCFARVCIPLNIRNSSKSSDVGFDGYGTPLCPLDHTPFSFAGKCGGKNRSERFKWVCPKSKQRGNTRRCVCETPCTDSLYGKCVYTYPDKDFRLYPGIARKTPHWDNLYKHRVVVERTINLFKSVFALDNRKTHNTISMKANLFLAGIIQLVGVLLAEAMNKRHLYKSVRKLIAA